jgi:hypothetical protein
VVYCVVIRLWSRLAERHLAAGEWADALEAVHQALRTGKVSGRLWLGLARSNVQLFLVGEQGMTPTQSVT